MAFLRPIAIPLASLALATGAFAQVSPTLPPARAPASEQGAAKHDAKAHTLVKKPAAESKPAATPSTASSAPAAEDPRVDLVYGAYQRGEYRTARDLALPRAEAGDPKAMTMLGELYSNALGVKLDEAKAVDWYRRASDAGDREAMFALAMMRIAGRGGPVDKGEAVKLLASAAKLGSPKAAYNLALLYLDGQTLPQD